jgi:hypothetical protein
MLMRALLLAALLAATLCAGCLGSDEKSARAPVPTVDDGVSEKDAARPASTLADPLPTQAALDARPSDELRTQLDAGAVALVDLVGKMDIRPEQIEFAKGGRLVELEWQRWDSRGAEGRGRMIGVVCEPDCGHGTQIEAPATIRLSHPVACPRGRFFDRGRIEVESDRPEAESTSWLAAPC